MEPTCHPHAANSTNEILAAVWHKASTRARLSKAVGVQPQKKAWRVERRVSPESHHMRKRSALYLVQYFPLQLHDVLGTDGDTDLTTFAVDLQGGMAFRNFTP